MVMTVGKLIESLKHKHPDDEIKVDMGNNGCAYIACIKQDESTHACPIIVLDLDDKSEDDDEDESEEDLDENYDDSIDESGYSKRPICYSVLDEHYEDSFDILDGSGSISLPTISMKETCSGCNYKEWVKKLSSTQDWVVWIANKQHRGLDSEIEFKVLAVATQSAVHGIQQYRIKLTKRVTHMDELIRYMEEKCLGVDVCHLPLLDWIESELDKAPRVTNTEDLFKCTRL